MSDQRPHLLTFTIDDEGYPRGWRTLGCPYEGRGERPCLLIVEADCQSWIDSGECELLDEGLAGCSNEVGHGHAIDGCGLDEYLTEGGIPDGAVFAKEFEPTTWPIPVTMQWDADGIVLSPILGVSA